LYLHKRIRSSMNNTEHFCMGVVTRMLEKVYIVAIQLIKRIAIGFASLKFHSVAECIA